MNTGGKSWATSEMVAVASVLIPLLAFTTMLLTVATAGGVPVSSPEVERFAHAGSPVAVNVIGAEPLAWN